MSSNSKQSSKRKDAPRFFIPSTGPSPATQTNLPTTNNLTSTLDPQLPPYPDLHSLDNQPSLPPNALPSVTAPTTPHPRRRSPTNQASQSQSISRLREALRDCSVDESGGLRGGDLEYFSGSGSGSGRGTLDLRYGGIGGIGEIDGGKGKGRADVDGREETDRVMMDGLIEIHKVLYRGTEKGNLKEDVKEVKRVLDKWFEGDCVYDHPLLRVGTKQSLFTHFILLHLASKAFVPSLSPGSLLLHARNVTSRIRRRVLGEDEEVVGDVEAGRKGKGKLLGNTEGEKGWYGEKMGDDSLALWNVKASGCDDGAEGWLKLWDVKGDCREIGTMETYDGYHLAMIEQVVSLTLLPTLARPRPVTSLLHSPSESSSSISTLSSYSHPNKASSPSFLRRLAGALADEFDYLLRWDLPISTLVAFNEVGKATHVRDMIDVRDAIETFVPLAKRLGWITRRLTGLVSSTVGGIAFGMIVGPAGGKAEAAKVIVSAYEVSKQQPPTLFVADEKHGLGSAIGLGSEGISPLTSPPVPKQHDINSLGLRGVGDGLPGVEGALGSMAPDCDAPETEGMA